MKKKQEIVIISAVRTAIGRLLGSLSGIPTGKLGAIVAKEAIRKAGIAPDSVDEVIFGSVLTAGNGQNISRQAALWAGLPVTVPAYTVDMVCGSGMMSIIHGIRSLLLGDAKFVLAGGAENMSAAPFLLPHIRKGHKIGPINVEDSLLKDGLTDVFSREPMGLIAEKTALKYNISRDEQDAFAQHSQEKAKAAIRRQRFRDEIVPVELNARKELVVFDQDEYPRFESTLTGLANLKAAFKKDGSITAGNASGINDGAAALLLTTREQAEVHGLKPIAAVKSWSMVGLEPEMMGLGPVQASRKALSRVKLRLNDIDLIECNEAFAAQCLAVTRVLEIDMEKLNVNGGAIALGHPIGASGARITVTLCHELKKQGLRYGLATLCIGGGMGAALILESGIE